MGKVKFISMSIMIAAFSFQLGCNQTPTASQSINPNHLTIEQTLLEQDLLSSYTLKVKYVEWDNFAKNSDKISENAIGLFTVYGDMEICSLWMESDSYTFEEMTFIVSDYEVVEYDEETKFKGSALGGDTYNYSWSMIGSGGKIRNLTLLRSEDLMLMTVYF